MISVDPPISVSALSPDNAVRISELCDLFFRSHGEACPAPAAADPRFWASQIELRLTSLAAFQHGRMIAHVALKADRVNPQALQLLLPVIDPEFLPLAELAASALADVIRQQCRRKSLQLLYHYVIADCALSAALNKDLFTETETAVCPGYLRNVGKSGTVFFSQVIPYPVPLGARDLYIPAQHIQICKKLYEPLGLQRNFSPRPSRDSMHAEHPRGMHLTHLKDLAVVHVEVYPSALNSIRELIAALLPHSNDSIFLFVNLSDPFTPDTVDELEGHGYRFCGILPVRKGCDAIVLWKERSLELSAGRVCSLRAKMLLSYTQDYNFESALQLLHPIGNLLEHGQTIAAA